MMFNGIDLPDWTWALLTVFSLVVAMIWLDHLKSGK
jgi:hypothetical protein